MKLNNNDDSHNSGLNLLIYNMLLDIESHPAWVCGLKQHTLPCNLCIICHTLRGCVDWNKFWWSKNIWRNCHTLRGCVDWNIEFYIEGLDVGVTPCVGVWIETMKYLSKSVFRKSHPAWVCGLKLKLSIKTRWLKVTPCVGVWIETYFVTLTYDNAQSHPAWVCGLKLAQMHPTQSTASHTLRGCVDWNFTVNMRTP